jgi:NADH-quinone oxidoreductase subunit N
LLISVVFLNIRLSSGRELVYLSDLRTLASSSSAWALSLTVAIISMAGLPPIAGFYSKFYLLKFLVFAGWNVIFCLVLGSTIISLYYYLRFIRVLWFDELPGGSVLSFGASGVNKIVYALEYSLWRISGKIDVLTVILPILFV